MGTVLGVRVTGVLRVVAWLGVVAALGACGDDDGGGPGGEATLDDFVSTYCRAARGCCARAGMDNPVLDDCEVEYPVQSNLLASVAAGTTVLRQPHFTDCVAAFRTIGQTCVIPDLPACAVAWSGTVPEGGACESANECVRGDLPVACLKIRTAENQDPPGVCHALARVQEGEACLTEGDANFSGVTYTTDQLDAPNAYCDTRDGLFCHIRPNAVCMPLAGPGEDCIDRDCVPSHFCDDTCVPRLARGVACTGSFQCEAGLDCEGDVCVQENLGSEKTCSGDYN